MSTVNLLISLDDEHIEQISEVIQNLKAAGLHVEQTMTQLGVITGSCDAAKVEAISQVKGVSHVETEQKYQIAPPDSDIQ